MIRKSLSQKKSLMVKGFYERIVFSYPKLVIALFFILLGFLGYYSTKLEIDASSKTLLLEGDKDYEFSRKIASRYEGPNFLIIAFAPTRDLLSKETLQTLGSLENDLLKVDAIKSVTALHNVPLLTSQNSSLQSLAEDIKTLQSYRDFDKEAVKEEFLTNPLYNRGLVSQDFKTTAIVVNLHDDAKFTKYKDKQKQLQERLENNSSSKLQQEYEQLQSQLKAHRDLQREQNAQNIAQIRQILDGYKDEGKLFLGGVNMIAADVIGFIKSDLQTYGAVLLLLFVVILWVVFRDIRWVGISLFLCLASIVLSTGTFGFFAKEVTVLSSNFISLQLIITLSLVLHLIVRYREVEATYSYSSQKRLLLNTMLSKFNPSLFAIITTIAGFSSLIFSSIKPVIDLGVMMSVAIWLSLVLVFVLFPALLILTKRLKRKGAQERKTRFMSAVSKIVKRYPKTIYATAGLSLVFSFSGASQLIVENSFINYFKSDTDIYRGMEVIDEKLGGTTPLDIIVDLKPASKQQQQEQEEVAVQNDDAFGFGDFEFDAFEEDLSAKDDEAKYWFTGQRLETIKKIQETIEEFEAVGDVQSLATLLKVGKQINNGDDLDSFELALMYDNVPQEYIDLVLNPYLSIENDQIRYATRIIDTTEGLRRDALLKDIKSSIEALELENVEQVRLGNLMVLYNNMLQSLFQSQILTLGVVAIVLLLMFYILFRSFWLAVIALVTNLVPISMVFGIMGWLGIPLDIMTITIAAISIGIGVDDTIHYIDRFKIEYMHTKDYEQAMINAHKSVGYAMGYTTLTVMVGFVILVTSNFLPTIYFGLLTVLVMALLLSSALLFLPRMLLTFKPKIAHK
ncbi:MAG: efflux RND transporter permease subunit [Campylobacterota bacterium]